MKITFLNGTEAGKSCECKPPGVFIGREADNDICLPLEAVSQYHAKILFSDEKWFFHDLDSQNGSKINGKSVNAPIPLRTRDVIHIASVALRIEFKDNLIQSSTSASKEADPDECDAVRIRGPHEKPSSLAASALSTKEESGDSREKRPKKKPKRKSPISRKHPAERELERLIDEIVRAKKRRLRTISIIITLLANALIFWWWFTHYAQ